MERSMTTQLIKSRKTEEDILPVPSGASMLETYFLWLREALQTMRYGEVGLHFTVHDGMVTGIRKDEQLKAFHYSQGRGK